MKIPPLNITGQEIDEVIDKVDYDRPKISDGRGISWRKSAKKWQAQPHYQGVSVYLGLFEDKEEAISVVNKWRAAHPLPDRSRVRMIGGFTAGGSSKYKGIRRRGGSGKFIARVGYRYKQYHIGRFKNEKEAALAYDKRAIELHGKDIMTNQKMFPEDFTSLLPGKQRLI